MSMQGSRQYPANSLLSGDQYLPGKGGQDCRDLDRGALPRTYGSAHFKAVQGEVEGFVTRGALQKH